MEQNEKDILEFKFTQNDILKTEPVFESDSKTNYDKMFEGLSYSNFSLKNRFCYFNLTDNSLIGSNGKPSFKFFEFYKRIAKSDVGLISIGGAYAGIGKKPLKKNYFKINFTQEEFECFKNFTTDIHSFGTKILFKIKSIYGRADSENRVLGLFSKSASNLKSAYGSKIFCVRASDGTCKKLVNDSVKLADFAAETGFDGIVVDMSLFSFIGELSSFELNKRRFGYFNERLDFAKKFLSKITNKFKYKLIIFELSFKSFVEQIYGNCARKIRTLKSFSKSVLDEKILKFLEELVKLGVDGFRFKFGTHETEFLSEFNAFEKENFLSKLYAKINNYFEEKKILNKFGNKVILIYNDNFFSLARIKNFREENYLFDVTKNLLANENILRNLGQKMPQRECIKCSLCNFACDKKNQLICAINPEITHFEQEFQQKSGNFAVIGSGYAGINAAIFLAEQGISVDLFEQESILNKHGKCREIFGFNEPILAFNKYLESRIHYFEKQSKIRLFLKHKFSPKDDNVSKYDGIIVSTGFHEKTLHVSGAVLSNVKSIFDALFDEKIIENSQNIVINAKSELSLSFALFLLTKNKNVSIIFEDISFIFDLPNDKLSFYLFELNKSECKVFVNAKIKRIEYDFVELIINNKLSKESFQSVILNMKSKRRYGYEAKAKSIDCDLFINEPETCPNNRLYLDLVLSKFSGKLFMIGNALQKSDIDGDIKSAFFVSKNI